MVQPSGENGMLRIINEQSRKIETLQDVCKVGFDGVTKAIESQTERLVTVAIGQSKDEFVMKVLSILSTALVGVLQTLCWVIAALVAWLTGLKDLVPLISKLF